MQTENEKAILDAVAGCPGASAGDIARHLGMDRSNVRRDAKKLERDGKLIKQNDGGTFRFYLAEPAQSYAPALSNSCHVAATSEPIDGIYKDVTEPAASRALAVTQPADSRLQAALEQHARARARREQGGVSLPARYVSTLNEVFAADPDGAETLAALQQAQLDRLKAATAHEEWLRAEYARQVAEKQNRLAREKKQRDDEWAHACIQRMYGLDGDEEPPPRRRARPVAYEEEPEQQWLIAGAAVAAFVVIAVKLPLHAA